MSLSSFCTLIIKSSKPGSLCLKSLWNQKGKTIASSSSKSDSSWGNSESETHNLKKRSIFYISTHLQSFTYYITPQLNLFLGGMIFKVQWELQMHTFHLQQITFSSKNTQWRNQGGGKPIPPPPFSIYVSKNNRRLLVVISE